ncbi:hypothetical protein H5410_055883 [Solanum commersonii]|uniref:Uncharacterized protein n=1 Tax=Solanum commersonii TaxID=4109 RepID=A0A9J5WK31_SOLCO|nr:hypothetical protein H5410_055883 [Solanum commersonii]
MESEMFWKRLIQNGALGGELSINRLLTLFPKLNVLDAIGRAGTGEINTDGSRPLLELLVGILAIWLMPKLL